MLMLTRTRIALPAVLLLALLLPLPRAAAEDASTQVRVTTNMGDFVIEVRNDRAPLTAANFLRYVR